MTIDELAATAARRIEIGAEYAELVIRTRELVRALYHDEGMTAKRIEEDTVRLLTTSYGVDEAQTRGLGLGEDAIRKAVGRRPKV